MASVQIRTKNGDYYAFFKGWTGKRTSRNTGTKNKREAQRMADGWEQQARAARFGPCPFPAGPKMSQQEDTGFRTRETFTSSYPPYRSLRWDSWRETVTKPTGSQTTPPGDQVQKAADDQNEEPGAVESEWIKFWNHRMPLLARMVAKFEEIDRHEESLSSLPSEIAWKTNPEVMGHLQVPSAEEHAATVEKAWSEAIAGKEKAAWGKMFLTAAGDINFLPVDVLAVHPTVPPRPPIGTNDELVLVIRDPQPPSTRYRCEKSTAISAQKRIRDGWNDLGLPEYSARILDEPFRTLELFQFEIDRMIENQGGKSTLSITQNERIRDFEINAANCLKRAYSLLTNEPLDRLLRATAWMSLTSQFTSATLAWSEARRTLNDEEEHRAKANLKLDDQKFQGRSKDRDRERMIQIMAQKRKAGLSKVKALDQMQMEGHVRFNRRKNPQVESPALVWIKCGKSWKGPKSIKTIDKFWTAVGKLSAK